MGVYNKGIGKGITFLRALVTHKGRDCVIWPYTIIPNGYGMLGLNGKILRANRLMCEMAHGSPPTSKHEAAHSCGVKSCVNPNHLSWKTPEANQRDRITHGTAGRPGVPRQKLSDAQVAEIRAIKGMTQQAIADRYHVTRELIGQIIRGQLRNGPPKYVHRIAGNRTKLAARAIKMRRDGMALQGIAQTLGVARGTVRALMREAGDRN